MIHINLNTIFYTHVEHSPTKTICIRYYMETHTHTHNDYSRNRVLILDGVLWKLLLTQKCHFNVGRVNEGKQLGCIAWLERVCSWRFVVKASVAVRVWTCSFLSLIPCVLFRDVYNCLLWGGGGVSGSQSCTVFCLDPSGFVGGVKVTGPVRLCG